MIGLCEECGSPLQKPARGRMPRFCSTACRVNWNQKRQRRELRALREQSPVLGHPAATIAGRVTQLLDELQQGLRSASGHEVAPYERAASRLVHSARVLQVGVAQAEAESVGLSEPEWAALVRRAGGPDAVARYIGQVLREHLETLEQ